jgi:transcriptional regulator with XRE-family HTH domain
MSRALKQQLVGEQVRRLREASGLSLRSLAKHTDFSASFISQLEHGLVSPSINSMERIAGALGVTLVEFFAATANGLSGSVVRSAQRKRLASSWSRGSIDSLAPLTPGCRLEPVLITLEPGGRSGKHPVAAPVEEFALVLAGGPLVTLGPDQHKLRVGDAVRILARELRLWQNPSKAKARILIVSLRAALKSR